MHVVICGYGEMGDMWMMLIMWDGVVDVDCVAWDVCYMGACGML